MAKGRRAHVSEVRVYSSLKADMGLATAEDGRRPVSIAGIALWKSAASRIRTGVERSKAVNACRYTMAANVLR